MPAAAALVVILIISIWYIIFNGFPSFTKDISFNFFSHKVEYTNPLDGEVVESREGTEVQVVGIMIDNHPDAWPQSGVSAAKIVYEVLVEGGLTRYFAIYDSKQVVPEVGPVRSARTYFLDWIQEYGNGLYVHSGGSPAALAAIKPRKVFDANEFFWGEYFWRATDHFAPHNLYISSENWQKMLEVRGNTTSIFASDKAWKYSQSVGVTLASSSQLKINFNLYYKVAWNYDKDKLQYLRSINRDVEKDKDGSEIWARNIVVQFTDVADITNDDKGRQEIKTTGSGDAIILKKGSVVYGTWKKNNIKDRTRFYDSNNQEVLFVPGNTWIEVLPKGLDVEITD
ncbi:MAG: hypothetical protein A2534_03440 [Candidatus Magasanikbacteria bacterium RIFOXYD2_FULL_39_9]|nr:MAG: hypothetical protein A2534_03440 [Candidatus Magasanikbacteria bacterium RIFOXYD2_FULL_39_9]